MERDRVERPGLDRPDRADFCGALLGCAFAGNSSMGRFLPAYRHGSASGRSWWTVQFLAALCRDANLHLSLRLSQSGSRFSLGHRSAHTAGCLMAWADSQRPGGDLLISDGYAHFRSQSLGRRGCCRPGWDDALHAHGVHQLGTLHPTRRASHPARSHHPGLDLSGQPAVCLQLLENAPPTMAFPAPHLVGTVWPGAHSLPYPRLCDFLLRSIFLFLSRHPKYFVALLAAHDLDCAGRRPAFLALVRESIRRQNHYFSGRLSEHYPRPGRQRRAAV